MGVLLIAREVWGKVDRSQTSWCHYDCYLVLGFSKARSIVLVPPPSFYT